MDGSPASEPRDCDRDGFEETIVIALEDAGRIVAKDAKAFYDKVRSKVGDWQLKPAGQTGGDEGPSLERVAMLEARPFLRSLPQKRKSHPNLLRRGSPCRRAT